MTTARSPGRRTRDAVLLVLGSLGCVLALVLAGAGGALLFVDWTQRDADGYVTSGSERFATPSYALVSESAHVDLNTPAWFAPDDWLGTVRVQVTATGDRPLFAGIARAADLDRYLAGTQHDVVADVDFRPFRVDYRRHEGGATAAAPADQGFWASSVAGTGTQVLSWRVADGDWRLVVMNAGAERGVEVDVAFGAKLGFLAAAGWGLVAAGGVLLLVGGVAIYLGARMPPAAPAVPATPAATAAPTAPQQAPRPELAGVGGRSPEKEET